MTYGDVKNKFQELKPRLVTVLCCAVMFAAGFGAGRVESGLQPPAKRTQLNYTKNLETSRVPATPPVSQTPKTGECIIKGNIGSGNKKTYHVPGGSFYERTNPEQCFATEGEAEAAGFTKSSR